MRHLVSHTFDFGGSCPVGGSPLPALFCSVLTEGLSARSPFDYPDIVTLAMSLNSE